MGLGYIKYKDVTKYFVLIIFLPGIVHLNL